jgi:hypothetical protein
VFVRICLCMIESCANQLLNCVFVLVAHCINIYICVYIYIYRERERDVFSVSRWVDYEVYIVAAQSLGRLETALNMFPAFHQFV